LCQKHDSLKKIELIAAGILRKNYKFVRRLEKIETRVKNLVQRINHAKEQLDALKIQLAFDKPNTAYKVISDKQSNNFAAIIADAILMEPQAVQLVARSTGNNLEMEKDWEMMSEFDKDEIKSFAKKLFVSCDFIKKVRKLLFLLTNYFFYAFIGRLANFLNIANSFAVFRVICSTSSKYSFTARYISANSSSKTF